MKRTVVYFVLAAFAFLAASCIEDEPLRITPEDTSGVRTWTVTVKAVKGVVADVTKVTLTDDGWEEDEADGISMRRFWLTVSSGSLSVS